MLVRVKCWYSATDRTNIVKVKLGGGRDWEEATKYKYCRVVESRDEV